MHYLAYGSNLHPLRLVLRVPNARFVGTTRLDGCRLAFHKRSVDGSAKCTLDFTDNPAHVAHGAVFYIPEHEIYLLDAAEGLGSGYDKRELTVNVADETLPVFVYLASHTHLAAHFAPYHWYKGFVLAGARKHRFPTEYLQQIADVVSKYDPEESRRVEMQNLLVQLEA